MPTRQYLPKGTALITAQQVSGDDSASFLFFLVALFTV